MGNILNSITSRLKKVKEEREEKPLISRESAMAEITELLDYYNISTKTLQMTEDTELAGERILELLLEYYRYGKLKNKKGESGFNIIQTLKNGKEIIYSEITAPKKRMMDKLESKESYGKIHSYMGSLSNIDLDGVDQLHATDLAVLEVLCNIFLLA